HSFFVDNGHLVIGKWNSARNYLAHLAIILSRRMRSSTLERFRVNPVYPQRRAVLMDADGQRRLRQPVTWHKSFSAKPGRRQTLSETPQSRDVNRLRATACHTPTT